MASTACSSAAIANKPQGCEVRLAHPQQEPRMGTQQPPGLHARRVPRLAAGQLAVCGCMTDLLSD